MTGSDGEAGEVTPRKRVVREIRRHRVEIGGDSHSGWLPAGAVMPRPTPLRRVELDLRIVQEAPNSYLLIWDGPDRQTTGDTWHEDLESAMEQAREWFGVEPSEWRAPTT